MVMSLEASGAALISDSVKAKILQDDVFVTEPLDGHSLNRAAADGQAAVMPGSGLMRGFMGRGCCQSS